MSKYGPAAQAKMHNVMQDYEDGRLMDSRAGRISSGSKQAAVTGFKQSRHNAPNSSSKIPELLYRL